MANDFSEGEQALLTVRILSKNGDYWKVRINSADIPAVEVTVHWMELSHTRETEVKLLKAEKHRAIAGASRQLPEGILPHQGSSGDFAAEECGRQAVTARFACLYLADGSTNETIWLYSKDNDDMGLDPWIELAGVGQYIRDEKGELSDDSFYIEYGRVGERRVNGDYRIYAQRKGLIARGFIK